MLAGFPLLLVRFDRVDGLSDVILHLIRGGMVSLLLPLLALGVLVLNVGTGRTIAFNR